MAIFLASTSTVFAFVAKRAWRLRLPGMFGLAVALLVSSVAWHGTKHPWLELPDKMLAHVCCVYPTIRTLLSIPMGHYDMIKSSVHLGSVLYNYMIYYCMNGGDNDVMHATIHIVGAAGALCYLDTIKGVSSKTINRAS